MGLDPRGAAQGHAFTKALYYCGLLKRSTEPTERYRVRLRVSAILLEMGHYPLALKMARASVPGPSGLDIERVKSTVVIAEALYGMGQQQAAQ